METCEKYDGDPVMKAGLTSYAYKQAHYHRERAANNKTMWATRVNDADAFLKKYTRVLDDLPSTEKANSARV